MAKVKVDKRKFSINIVSRSDKDNHYKHLDSKERIKLDCEHCETVECSTTCPTEPLHSGLQKAVEEAKRLADSTGRKVTVMQSLFNVYPETYKLKEEGVVNENV